jgi:ComF family protein
MSSWDWALDWLFPPRCRFCGEGIAGRDEDCFCAACRRKIRLVTPPLCPACGRPYLDVKSDDHLCGACLTRGQSFVQARAWACYPAATDQDHPLREVLQRFKYGRKISLGKPLGRLLAKGCQDSFVAVRFDFMIPVPLHPKRLRWRGFNQALVLAREVGRRWQVPVDPFILLRARETAVQTELSEEERRKNVRGVFTVHPEKSVEGKVLLLVDDVYTSGATANECSRALRKAGAKEVYVLTLARTVS